MSSIDCHTTSRVFRLSRYDAIFVATTLLDLLLRVYLVMSLGETSWWAIAGTMLSLVVLNAMNYECAGHFFIHCPFFRSKSLNALYSVLNSLAFGFPQTFYRAEHLCHHRYNNDYPDPETGKARDLSSIYQHGPSPNVAEMPWKYAIMSAWRQDASHLFEQTPKRLRALLIAEFILVGSAYLAVLFYNPLACLALLFIAWSGSFISNFQNWLEHAHADPRSRLTDSVSCYGRFYNLVWFNNGYHQEHHATPSVHWTKLPLMKAQMLPPSERRVVPYAHFWNLRAG